MNARQLKEVVIVPVLTALGLNSPSAVMLLLGTAAQESQMGKFIVQQGIGFKGGIGIFQCESATYLDLCKRYIVESSSMKAKIRLFLGYEVLPNAQRMASDLALATVMARIKYLDAKAPLPAADDIAGLAAYWKRFYNSEMGAGTEREFIENYNRYVIL